MAPNQQLNNISLMAFAFVAIVVIVNLFTTNNYGKSNNQVVQAITGQATSFTYHDLQAIANGNNSSFQLVDLRSPEDFEQGHLPGALNIPFENIIDKSSMRKLNKLDGTPVFYADRESVAHSARMLLLAKGFNGELQVMGGTYLTAMEHAIEDFRPAFANYREEKARFDFARFMRGIGEAKPEQRPSGIIPVRVEVTGAAGGC